MGLILCLWLHKPNFPSLVFVFFPFSSGLSWWRSYQNWGSFMIQTPWSSWPGLGRRIHRRSQIQSAHHIEANLIRLFLQIEFHRASCPWLVRVWACPCACMRVSRRLFVGESVWWVMRADGYPWIRHGSAGKDPAVGRALTHLRVSVAGLPIKSITLIGSEMELWFGNAPNCRWCCCVFAHLCARLSFSGRHVGCTALDWPPVVHILHLCNYNIWPKTQLSALCLVPVKFLIYVPLTPAQTSWFNWDCWQGQ